MYPIYYRPSEAAKDADVVLMCVGDDNDVRTVAKEAIAAMNEGTLLIDHTTASATVAKEINAKIDITKRRDFFITAWLLMAKLVTGEPKNFKSLVFIARVQVF